MKTSTVSHASGTVVVVLALAVLSTGCTATRAVRRAPAESGFLGDYSGLQKNTDFPSALVYVKPDVQWGRYSAIELESADLYLTDTSTAPSPEDQTLLAGMLYNTMTEELGKYFELVTTPAPNALRVRTAWSQTPSAKVVFQARPYRSCASPPTCGIPFPASGWQRVSTRAPRQGRRLAAARTRGGVTTCRRRSSTGQSGTRGSCGG